MYIFRRSIVTTLAFALTLAALPAQADRGRTGGHINVKTTKGDTPTLETEKGDIKTVDSELQVEAGAYTQEDGQGGGIHLRGRYDFSRTKYTELDGKSLQIAPELQSGILIAPSVDGTLDVNTSEGKLDRIRLDGTLGTAYSSLHQAEDMNYSFGVGKIGATTGHDRIMGINQIAARLTLAEASIQVNGAGGPFTADLAAEARLGELNFGHHNLQGAKGAVSGRVLAIDATACLGVKEFAKLCETIGLATDLMLPGGSKSEFKNTLSVGEFGPEDSIWNNFDVVYVYNAESISPDHPKVETRELDNHTLMIRYVHGFGGDSVKDAD